MDFLDVLCDVWREQAIKDYKAVLADPNATAEEKAEAQRKLDEADKAPIVQAKHDAAME